MVQARAGTVEGSLEDSGADLAKVTVFVFVLEHAAEELAVADFVVTGELAEGGEGDGGEWDVVLAGGFADEELGDVVVGHPDGSGLAMDGHVSGWVWSRPG